MSKIIRVLPLLIIGAGISFVTRAQKMPLPNINIPTPNASSLGQYGRLSVSLFSGRPRINIPIYELHDGKFTLPISLSYNYSGNRPNLPPGWAGLGWTLMAGGVITRIQKGAPDEYYNTALDIGEHYGYWYNFNHLNNSNWNTSAFVQDYAENQGSFYELTPDEFNFNFLGISGSFYLDHTGQWRVKSDRDIKVTFTGNFIIPFVCPIINQQPDYVITRTFEKFILTDEDGIQYYFGDGEAIEYSSNWLDQSGNELGSFTATSWYLTKVVLTNGQVINFNYERGPFISQFDKYYNYQLKYYPGGSSWLDVPCGQDGMDALLNARWFYSAKFLSPLYLKSIESSNCKIVFSISPSNAKYYSTSQYNTVANSINGKPITSGSADPVFTSNKIFEDFTFTGGAFKDFGIQYYIDNKSALSQSISVTGGTVLDYITRRMVWMKLDDIRVISKFDNSVIKNYHFDYNENSLSRLKLTELQCLDQNNTLINKYSFEYNTTSLPDYITDMTDHWGYYNGTSLSGATPSNFSGYKSSNPTYVTAELLEKIIYPTGGYTVFVPEINRYSKMIDVNNPSNLINSSGIAGGVRIKKIVNGDGLGHENHTDYYYVTGYSPTTDVNSLPSSGEISGIPRYAYENLNGITEDGGSYIYSIFSSQPVIPTSQNAAGQYIGYSEVVEKRSDGGYSINKYTNYSDGVSFRDTFPAVTVNAGQYPYLPIDDRSEMRGKIKSVSNYNQSGQKISESIFSYQPIHGPNDYIRSLYAIQQPVCNTHWVIIGCANKIYTFSYLPVTKVERTYNGSSYVEESTNFVYHSSYKKVISKTTMNSDNKTITHIYKYPFDYPDDVYQTMVSRNIISPIITDLMKVNGTSIKLKRLNYKQWDDGIIEPEKFYVRYPPDTNEGGMKYYMYDQYGNPDCMGKINDKKISYEWEYNGAYPVVRIENAENTYKSEDYQVSSIGYGSLRLPMGSTQTYTLFFTVDMAGTTNLSIGFSGNPGINPMAKVSCYLYGPDDYFMSVPLCVASGTGNCGTYPSNKAINDLAPGQYRLTASYYESSNLNCDINVYLTYPIYETQTMASGLKEFYYEGFEELANAVAGNSHTGQKYYQGDFTVPYLIANGRKYKIDYWYFNGTSWKYLIKNYVNNMQLTEGLAIDDIRIYPADALMTTYTYKPLVGPTSEIDSKGKTIYYEYDTSGRLKLIRDQNRNIIKQFDYQYQAND